MKQADLPLSSGTSRNNQKPETGWQAGLQLDIYAAGNKSILRQTKHHGPLQTQRPFYPEGDEVCHAYILHPPGGVVGGDQLEVKVTVHERAKALITTPAAGKFYRSSGHRATLNQTLVIADNSVLEWLPQENIVYNQAQAAQVTKVELGNNSCFLGWEISCLGLPASNAQFKQGLFQQAFDIRHNSLPLMMEKISFAADSTILKTAWGLQNHSVCGTMICNQIPKELSTALLDEIRTATAALKDDDLFSATTISGMIVCRYLGQHAYKAKGNFIAAWKILRQKVLGRPACLPRIWNT